MKRHLKHLLLLLLPLTAQAQQPPMRLWYDRPAQFFEESLPIGNGRLGACIYGGTDDNTLFLNDITLWTGKPVDPRLDADAHQWIPEIRKALFNEDYALADSLQLRVQGPNSQFYQPLATFHMLDDNKGEVTGYERRLCLDSALCSDSYTRGGVCFTREYFASHPDKTIAMRVVSDGPNINCRLVLTSQVPHNVKASVPASRNGQLTMTGHAIGDERESTHFCTIMRAQATDGVLTAKDSMLTVSGARSLIVYFVNETSFNGALSHPVSEGASYVANATDD